MIFSVVLSVGMMAAAQSPTTLKNAYHGAFYIGAAINAGQIKGNDAIGSKIVAEQFDSISPENALKWERICLPPISAHM